MEGRKVGWNIELEQGFPEWSYFIKSGQVRRYEERKEQEAMVPAFTFRIFLFVPIKGLGLGPRKLSDSSKLQLLKISGFLKYV